MSGLLALMRKREAMRYFALIFALLLIYVPTVVRAETPVDVLSLPRTLTWTGDFDGLLQHRIVRILVVPSKTFFFLDKADTLGVTAETGQEFESGSTNVMQSRLSISRWFSFPQDVIAFFKI